MGLSSLHNLPTSNDPHCVLACRAAGAAGFRVIVTPIPGCGSLVDHHHATPSIFVAHAGFGRRRYQRGLRTLDLQIAPRMIEVYEADLTFDHVSWSGEAGRCVQVEFRDADVMAMTHGDLWGLALRTQHEVFDDRVSRLALALGQDVVAGMPSGPLYAQGLSLALLGVLHTHHSRDTRPLPAARSVLTPHQKRRLIGLVAAAYAVKLTLDRLAAEVRLSPHHFARLFKASFGVTPHSYVQSVRLDAAARALRAADGGAISAIAGACGFASQSHPTEVMRRHIGITPSAMRRGQAQAADLGLRAGGSDRGTLAREGRRTHCTNDGNGVFVPGVFVQGAGLHALAASTNRIHTRRFFAARCGMHLNAFRSKAFTRSVTSM